jgi:GNAT superfamily N-acetyltransferase
MEIRPLDASDPEAMRAWHALHTEAHAFGLEHPSPWMLEEMRAEFLADRVGRRIAPFSGYVDGRLVVTGVLELPLLDNVNHADVDVATPPDLRRRGYGSAMLEHLTSCAAGLGRDTLDAAASWRYDAPADGSGTPNADFLTSHGFTFSLGDVKRALALPVDDGLLTRLAADAAPYHRDYEIRSWAGAVPDDVIDGFGALVGSLITEAPMGAEQDFEPEVFDAARIRDDEEVLAEAGRTKYTTIATAPDGEVVAYSEVGVPGHDPEHLYQWGTLVLPSHRGHRLGMATKVQNLRRLQAAERGRRLMFTWNAEVNRHMVAVNEALGFAPVGRLGEFVKKL